MSSRLTELTAHRVALQAQCAAEREEEMRA